MTTPAPDAQSPAGRRSLIDQAWLLMALPALFWAGNAVLGRAVAGEVPPVALAFWRWTMGVAVVLPFAWKHLVADRHALRRSWRMVVLLSVLGIGSFNTLLYMGLQTTTALNAVMLQSAMPVLIVLMSFVFFRDTVAPRQGLGIAVSMAGALVLIARGDPTVLAELRFVSGDLFVLAAVVLYAAYTTLLRRGPKVHGLSFVVTTFAIGSLVLLPFYLAETASGRPLPVTPTAAAAIAYVAVFPSIMAYLCFNRAVALVGANTAGLAIHLIPVFGSLLAIAFLGEVPHLYHGVGVATIAVGIALATRAKR